MIEQQMINSIMLANCNKYFGHPQQQQPPHPLQYHPQSLPSASSSSVASSAAATKNISANNNLVKMSNSVASGATTNSLVAMMNNTKANGMSSSVGSSASSIGASPAPASPQQQQPAIANKMGSRRIFSPHFKIQVLESYRNDNDCKGNQRATARKYGIHRRQIQKWLQCETALRTSVSNSSNGGGNSPGSSTSSPLANGSSSKVDSNNNNGQKRSLNGNGIKTAPSLLSTSSNHQASARHCVVVESNGAVRVAAAASAEEESQANSRLIGGGFTSVCETNTVTRLGTHTRQNSVEFFSSTTSLIINGHGAAVASGAGGCGSDGGDGGRKMNEAAAVPIKPEFRFNAASSTSASSAAAAPLHHHQHQHHHHHPSMNRGVEMPSTAAMLNQHNHHHHLQHQEDAPHHSVITPSVLPPSFISTIYGSGLLAFPTPRLPSVGPFPFDYPSLCSGGSVVHLNTNSSSIPIDLSMGNAERRHAGESRRSPLIHVDDARVPSGSGDGNKARSSSSPLSPSAMDIVGSSPIDLSCGRKRKANSFVVEPAKPPKLFKPYLLDDKEEEEELKVVDDAEEESLSTASLKEESFLDQDLTGLKDKLGRRFEYTTAWSGSNSSSAHHQYYPGASPAYEGYYYGHENLTLYPSPRHHYRYESQSSLSPSAASSPLHHPSRPASLFDSSTSSEAGFYHPSSPGSSDVRSSPPVFSLDLKLQSVARPSPYTSSNWEEMKSRIGAVY